MPCFVPLKGFRAQGGRIVFNRTQGWSDRPIDVPCGQCRGCRWDKKQEWAIRILHEAQMHEENCFITLTYDKEHLPKDLSLDVSDFQRFVRKLRDKVGQIRYFHCGEYGDENLRPHYHGIIFGYSFPDRLRFKESSSGSWLYRSDELERLWGLGFSTVGDVSYDSAAYCAAYVTKKVSQPEAADKEVFAEQSRRYEERYKRYDSESGETWMVKPEYATMSRRPGLGAGWLRAYKDDVYPWDEVVVRGRKLKVPRYYDKQLREEYLEVIKAERARRMARRSEDLTPERLRVREKIMELREQRKKREL